MIKKLAKFITESTYHDKRNNTLYVTNPGISYETLKGLTKKHNFHVKRLNDGEYISVPMSQRHLTDNSNFSLYDDFLSSYTNFDKNLSTLQSAYKTFDLMDENLAEISLMLDTYTSEILSEGFVKNPLKIKISNKEAQKVVEKVLYRNNIYKKLPRIIRSVAKYGNLGIKLSYPHLESLLNTKEDVENVTFTLNVEEDLVLSFVNAKYFIVNVDDEGNPISYKTEKPTTYVTNLVKSNVFEIWQPWQFVHFLLEDDVTDPYGKSMLWSLRSAFDQLTTLEALLGISRASNIQRLVFYVPVPQGTNMVDAYTMTNDFKANYLNSVFTDYSNDKAGRKIPGAMSILVLPETHDGKKTTVDTIEAKIDLSSTEDVEYFLNKILRNSKLPKGYLVGDETITTAQTLESQDLKLKRALLPLKDAVLTGILRLCENILAHAGYDVSKITTEVELNAPIQIPSDTLAKYGEIGELLKSLNEINPEMTSVNKFQFLVKMGMSSDIASLICATSTISVLDNVEDLGRFLIGQKTSNGPKQSLEECVSYSVSSANFNKENPMVFKDLVALNNTLKIKGKNIYKDLLLCETKMED